MLPSIVFAAILGVSALQNSIIAPATASCPAAFVNRECDSSNECVTYCGLWGAMGPVKIRPGHRVAGAEGLGETFNVSGRVAGFQDAVLWMAGAEYEGVQLAIIPAAPLTDVRVSITEFRDNAGVAFPGKAHIYREGTVNIDCISGPDAFRLYPDAPAPGGAPGHGAWPDIMIPQRDDEFYNEPRNVFPVAVGPGTPLPWIIAYVEFFAPWGTRGGPYRGYLNVSWLEGGTTYRAATIPFAIRLFDFDLPSERALPQPYGYSLFTPVNTDGICRGHFFDPADPSCATRKAAVERLDLQYREMLLRHRVSPDPHMTTGVTSTAYDFALFDSAYQCYLTNNKEAVVPFSPAWQSFTGGSATREALYAAWNNHFSDADLRRMFDYTCDEPLNATSRCGDNLASRATTVATGNSLSQKTLPRLVTTNLSHALNNESNIDVLVPLVRELPDQALATQHLLSWLTGPSRQLWWYQSCDSHGCTVGGEDSRFKSFCSPADWEDDVLRTFYTGWPNYMIDASGVQNRSMPWLAFGYGAVPTPAGPGEIRSELYWNVTSAHAVPVGGTAWNPWADVYYAGGNGDGTLMYPGRVSYINGTPGHDIPLSSLRLKFIRDGIEDHYILRAAEALNVTWSDGSTARDHARFVLQSAAESDVSARMLTLMRMDIGFALSHRLATDRQNCGAIGNVCTGADTSCLSGKCAVAGTIRYQKCSGSCCPQTPANCGEFGRICTQAPVDGIPTCTASSLCGFACRTGYSVCNNGTSCCQNAPPPPPGDCPASQPYDCCGDGSACMATRSKCSVVAC
jgi:hypothetical protein